jgi:hypothetical protein
MSFNGRPVNKILVDGRSFFGEDGALALKNIPVELIDKIQIHDLMTEQEKQINLMANTGEEKTLNIKLKPGNKYFVNAYAGTGTDDRYEGRMNAFAVRDARRICFFGGLNNINKSSVLRGKEVMVVTNGGGITKALDAGAEYQDKRLVAGYRFNHPDTYQEYVLERRQNAYSGAGLNSFSSNEWNNQSQRHDLNFDIRDKSGNKSVIQLFYLVRSDEQSGKRQTRTESNSGDMLNKLQNHSTSTGSSDMLRVGYNQTLLNEKNRSLSLRASMHLNDQQQLSNNYSVIEYFKDRLIDSISEINQQTDILNKMFTANTDLSFMQRLSETWDLNINQSTSLEWNKLGRFVYGLEDDMQQGMLDSLLSNEFKSNRQQLVSQFGAGYSTNLFSARFTLNLQQNYLNQYDLFSSQDINLSQVNFFPSALVSIKQFRFQFNPAFRNPGIEQLQPVRNNSNPLLIKVGNPNLKSAIYYNSTLVYSNAYSSESGILNFDFEAELNFSPVSHSIIAKLDNDSVGKQVISYVNVDGTSSLNGRLSGTLGLRQRENLCSISTLLEVRSLKDRLYINGLLNDTRTLVFNPELIAKYSYSDQLEAEINYSPSIYMRNYLLNKSANQNYTLQNISGNLSLYLFDRLKWKNTLLYNYNSQFPDGFDKSSFLWNAEFSYLLLKRKAELKLTGFDLLKQNNNMDRRMGNNYIEDTQSNNLQQYFLLGFSYNFNKLGKS